MTEPQPTKSTQNYKLITNVADLNQKAEKEVNRSIFYKRQDKILTRSKNPISEIFFNKTLSPDKYMNMKTQSQRQLHEMLGSNRRLTTGQTPVHCI